MSISSVNGVASTVSRYRFVAAGGETSLSGTDANGATLSYLIGKEEVYLNGALLVRGQDYTGTDGATISSLTALVAGDTLEIITFVPFAIPTAISSSTVTTQGDLIVATGASAVTRLGVGSSGTILTSNGTTPAYTSTITGTLNNGTLTGTLTAASTSGTSGQYLQTTGSGVQWASVSAGAGNMAQIATGSMSGTSITFSSLSNYQELILQITGTGINSSTNNWNNLLRINGDSSSNYIHNGWEQVAGQSTAPGVATANGSAQNALMATPASDIYGTGGGNNLNQYIKLTNCKTTGYTDFRQRAYYTTTQNGNNGCWVGEGIYTVSGAVSSLVLSPSIAAYGAGTYTLWGA